MKIFWRIFLAFLLVSLSVMSITAAVVIHRLEGSRAIEQHQQNIAAIAETIIELHESGEPLPHRFRNFNPPGPLTDPTNKPPSPRSKSTPPPNFHRFPHGLKIESEDGEVLFRRRFRNDNSEDILSTTVISDSGKRYIVSSIRPSVPLFFKTLLTHTFSIQFIFILIGSILVSATLSWSLTRPLKKLGHYSRHFAQGDSTAAIDVNILQRRDELGALANDLDYMSAKIRATLDAQQQLLHDVSHELRAPLARLQASVALMEKKYQTSHHTDRMHKECERINALIQQILDFSRLNRNTEVAQPCDVVELIEEVLESLQFEFKKHVFSFQPPSDRTQCHLYKSALQGALDNILRNACHYTPVDAPIEITLKQHTQHLQIIVRDHGPGVKEAEIEKLLQPFYRSGHQMHTEGFGLGLSIAQKALAKHHGSLKLNNHPQGGLEVVMELGCQTL